MKNECNFEMKWLRYVAVGLACFGVVVVGLLPVLEGLFILFRSDLEFLAWLGFLGKLHPVVLHIPIGVFVYVTMCELLKLLTRGRVRVETDLALLLGCAGAVLATLFGYLLYLTGAYGVAELLEDHKRDGLVFTLFALFALLAKSQSRREGARKVWGASYSVFLVVALFALVGAGKHGGEVTHGSPWKAWPPAVLDQSAQSDSADSKKLVYQDLVKPILAEKCVNCHGPEKQKGGLRCDSIAAMRAGGDSGDCLEPYQGGESLLVESLLLPLNDDLRMPPESKPQLTERELQVLLAWARAGASSEMTLDQLELE